MSKFKLFVWVLILAFIGIVLFQNDGLFLGKQALGIDFYFVSYRTPELPVAIYFLATLVIGLIVSYLFGLSDKFKARRTIKGLTSTLDAQRDELSSLKREIEVLKSRPPESLAALSNSVSHTFPTNLEIAKT